MTVRLPIQFAELRPVQTDAVARITDAWARGVKIVIWQAPVGAGKTIGAVASAERAQIDRCLYVCSGRQLQDQFARDFPCAVLKGRSNYPTMRAGWFADSCNKMGKGENAVCTFCDPVADCAYQTAKRTALGADLACVNTTYFLTEANGPGGFAGWPLVVVDEADALEGEIMRYLEFKVPVSTARQLGLEVPRKGVHRGTQQAWLTELSMAAAKAGAGIRVTGGEDGAAAAKEKSRLLRMAGRAGTLAEQIAEDGGTGTWVRTYDDSDNGAFVLKPVTVDEHAHELVWDNAERWLVMSGTILSAERFAADLGLDGDEWEFIDSPSTFPAENRPVVVCGIANMNKREMETTDAVDRMVAAVQAVVDRHGGENILIHCHTYALARRLAAEVRPDDGRMVHEYTSSRDREAVVARFRRSGGVLVAPSLARGVDLPDDLCRVMIVCKMPFGYLGDPQIKARMSMQGGQTWYDMNTARELMQMTGRGVRHEGDWAVSYVLDGGFLKTVWKRKALFPVWWREAVVPATARQVLEGTVALAGLPVVEHA